MELILMNTENGEKIDDPTVQKKKIPIILQ